MHDRENARLLEIVALDFFIVRKQSRDSGITAYDRLWDVGVDHGWNLALCEHGVHMLSRRNHFDPQACRWRELDIFTAIDDPNNFFVRHAVMLFQDPAQPSITGRLKVGAPYSFADQILWRFDAGVYVDEGKAVAKSAVKKNRNRRDRYIAHTRYEISADIEFTDVVFEISRHTPVALSGSVSS